MVSRNLSVIEPSVQRWDFNPKMLMYQVFLTTIIIIGNSSLLLFIVKYRNKLLKANIFILSLTVSDLLSGLLSTPFAHYVCFYDVSQIYCDFHQGVGQFFARISSVTIMTISIDRLMKLEYPIAYNNTEWRRMKHRLLIIGIIWISSAILTTLKFIDSIFNSGNYTKGCFFRVSYSTFEQTELLITVMGSNIIALGSYAKIMLLVSKTCRTEGTVVYFKKTSHRTLNDTEMVVNKLKTPNDSLRKHLGRSGDQRCYGSFWRSYIILGLIVILNLIFVTAPPLLFSLHMICETCVPPAVFQSMAWTFWTSCAVNPIIFALMNKDFRSFILFRANN